MLEAAASLHGSEALHYAANRWLELLDPTTHFSRAATSVLDPVTAVAELRASSEDLINGLGTKYSEVLEEMRMARQAVQADPNLAQWFANDRRTLLDRLKRAAQLPNRLTEDQKQSEVRRRARRLLRGPVASLEAAMQDPSTGYDARLLDAVTARFHVAPTDSAGWRTFDRDLTLLASLALSQGRDAALLGEAVVIGLARAADATGAAQALRAEITRQPVDHDVVVVVDGATGVRRANAFGFVSVETGDGWDDAPASCDEVLRSFFAAQQSAGVCALVRRRVRAHDQYAAHALALSAAEELVAHLIAEHRVNDISLRREALVLDRSASQAYRVPRPPRAAGKAHALGRRPLPALSDSLRHYARARAERAPTLAVRDTWVALEGVAHGATRILANGKVKPYAAGSFVPPHAAAATVLAATRNQLVSLWQLLRDVAPDSAQNDRWTELADWLGIRRRERHVALRRFARLVAAADGSHPAPQVLRPDASVEDAGAVLVELARGLGPYSRQRVAEVQERLANAERLGDWCALIDLRAQLQLRRMKFLRHRVMHRAVFEEPALQLAVAGHDLADAVFEVLPHFMGAGSGVPWEALQDALAYRDALLARWRQTGSAAPNFNPERCVRPYVPRTSRGAPKGASWSKT